MLSLFICMLFREFFPCGVRGEGKRECREMGDGGGSVEKVCTYAKQYAISIYIHIVYFMGFTPKKQQQQQSRIIVRIAVSQFYFSLIPSIIQFCEWEESMATYRIKWHSVCHSLLKRYFIQLHIWCYFPYLDFEAWTLEGVKNVFLVGRCEAKLDFPVPFWFVDIKSFDIFNSFIRSSLFSGKFICFWWWI